MIYKSHQDWSVGEIVKVGFMTLRVIDTRDGGTYLLKHLSKEQYYEFTPYLGVVKL